MLREGERESGRAGGWASLLQGAVQVWLCETHISRNFQQLDVRLCLLDFLPKHLQLYKKLCFWLCLYFCPPHAQICAASNATGVLKMPPPAVKKPEIYRGAQVQASAQSLWELRESFKCSGGGGKQDKQTSILLSI